ncbi:hypothetical protein H6F94_11055 [Leptolyngbya sp. FACHB-261]|nr:hypothetical protein [Leptolyngbya sp. FACHB-261]
MQETAIRLSREDLQQPAILEVQTSGRWLQGTVAINGQTVANLSQPRTTIRLNRWLRQGTQRIDISGRYGSIDHSLQIQFRAGGTVTSQQTRGTGSFRQTLRLIVSKR